ncbi:MAG TPA: D-amino acid aminotransferase [Gemmatimonadaceae bacterium]|nr:D-amino acid aminotransferase [Gemmatimonadaceae bacterium]
MLVFLNGRFIDSSEARVSVEDRGFLFADGVYEVIRIYEGRPFLMDPHMARLRDGLAAIRIAGADVDAIPDIADRLLRDNGLAAGEATIYIQVTRGQAPRAHAFPPEAEPTVYVATPPFRGHPAAYFEEGTAAVTVPDTRWSRCDIKSIALLPNVLANQAAKERDAFEALFVRDGVLIEGSHSNLFGVRDGELVTYPACNYILDGITRRFVIALAETEGIPVRLAALAVGEIDALDELFLSGTTTEVMPVTRVDGRPIADGRPGPITHRLRQAYLAHARPARAHQS